MLGLNIVHNKEPSFMNMLVTCWVLAPKDVLSNFFFYYCYFSFKKQDKTTYGIPTDLAVLRVYLFL